MASLRRRVSLTLLSAGLSVAVLASAYAQEAEEPTAGEVDPSSVIVEEPVADFVAVAPELGAPVVELAAPPVAAAPAPLAEPIATAAPSASPLPATSPAPAAAPVPAVAGKLAVAVIDNRFQPNALTIAPGTTVTWTNNGNNIHTLTSIDGAFDSGGLVGGASFTFTFDKAGTYRLICRQHGLNGMAGQVVVQ